MKTASFITYMEKKKAGDATQVYGATTGMEGLKHTPNSQLLAVNARLLRKGGAIYT